MTRSVLVKRHVAAVLMAWLFSAGTCWSEVAPVAISAPQPKVWRGKRATFFVELRANGTFVGASSF